MQDLLTEKVYVDGEGEKYISIACRQYNMIAVIFILTSFGNFTLQLLRFLKYSKETFHNWLNIFTFYVFPFIVVVQLCLSLAQLYYYYNGVKLQRKAIDGSDNQLFNKSFLFYKKGNSFGIVSMIIGLCYVAIFIYQILQPDK